MGGLLIFSAPSGSGKSTIVKWLMDEHPELKLAFSISATNRKPRCNNGVMERNGIEYYFLTTEEFKAKIAAGEFLEFEEVYENRFYGTLKAPIDDLLRQGYNVIFDIDVKGGVNVKKFFGDKALSIFVQPPSLEELRRRLEGRGSDTPEQIFERISKAEFEMTFASQFDKIVVNDDLETAKQETLKLVQEHLKQI